MGIYERDMEFLRSQNNTELQYLQRFDEEDFKQIIDDALDRYFGDNKRPTGKEDDEDKQAADKKDAEKPERKEVSVSKKIDMSKCQKIGNKTRCISTVEIPNADQPEEAPEEEPV